jgi:hypothetical protein
VSEFWNLVLRSWISPRLRSERYKGRPDRPIDWADVRVERMFELPAESVQPCLQVLDGYPVRYGVVVGVN